MQKEQSDQELNLKKRARRRLVGAIALVLLMIIVLPMLLKDRAATTPEEQITITLPNEPSQNSVAATTDFDSTVVPADNSTANQAPAAAIVDEPESTPNKPVTEVENKPTNTEKADDANALKETPTKETPNAAVAKEIDNKKFYVQVGVFSDVANVKQLQSKLSDLGYQSQTEKISTDKGQKIRLRTQVFNDRNEAAIALENIKDAGLTGMVVSQ